MIQSRLSGKGSVRGIARALGSKPGLFTLLSFSAQGVPRVVTAAAATSLFLSTFGARLIPLVFVGSAILVPAVGAGYLWLERRTSLWTLAKLALVLDAAVLAACWAGIETGLARPFILLAMVWVQVEWPLSDLVVWGLAGRMVTIREGKATFGRLGVGEPVARMVVGAAIPVALVLLHTTNLLLVSAGSMLASTLVVLALRVRHGADLQSGESDPKPLAGRRDETESDGWLGRLVIRGSHRNYVYQIFAIVFASLVVDLVVGTAFATVSEAAFPVQASLTSFLALFMAGTAGVTLLLRLVVSAPLMRRYGVGAALLATPFLCALAAAVALGGSMLPEWLQVVFLAVAGMRLIEEGLYNGLHVPALQTVYQPVPPAARTRAQAIGSGYVEPLAALVSGLVLLPLTQFAGVGAIGLSALTVVLCIGWLVLAWRMPGSYAAMLGEAFRRRRISADAVDLDPESSRALAQRNLVSENPGAAIYALSLLEQLDAPEELAAAAVALTAHSVPSVRLAALETIAKGRLTAARPGVTACLAVEREPRVRAGALRALAVIDGEDAIDALTAHLEHPSPEVRVAAMARLMLDGGIEGTLACGQRFLALHRSQDGQERLLAARVLDEIASAHIYRLLLQNLKSDDSQIRRLALHTAGRIGSPLLQPVLLAALPSPTHGAAAAAALVAFGEPVLTEVTRLYDADADGATRGRLTWLVGRIGTAQAVEWLLERGQRGSLDDRWSAAQALDAARSRAGLGTEARLWRLALDAARCVALLDGLSLPGEGSMAINLRLWVAQARRRQLHRLFLLLGCLLPRERIRGALWRLEAGSEIDRDQALEMVDALLPIRYKAPVMDAIEMRRRPVAGSARSAGRDGLGLLAVNAGRLFGDSTQAAALLACCQLGVELPSALISDLLAGDHRLPGETLRHIMRPAEALPAARPKEKPPMLMIEKVLLLHTVPAFRDVPEDVLIDLATTMGETELEAGQWLMREGEVGDRLFVIAEGEVAVFKGDLEVTHRGAGDVVGEMAALDPEVRSASIRAETDCLVLVLEHSDLAALLAGSVELAQGLLRMLCRRLRQSYQQLEELGGQAPAADTAAADTAAS